MVMKVFNFPAENSELNLPIPKVFVENIYYQLELNICKYIFAKTCKGILRIKTTILAKYINIEVTLF